MIQVKDCSSSFHLSVEILCYLPNWFIQSGNNGFHTGNYTRHPQGILHFFRLIFTVKKTSLMDP